MNETTKESKKEPENHTSAAGVIHGGGGTRKTEEKRPGGTYTSTFTVKNNRSHEDMANPYNIAKAKLKEVNKR